MSTRPSRASKISAIAKIAKIMQEEKEYEEEYEADNLVAVVADKSSSEDNNVTSAHTPTPPPTHITSPALTSTPAPTSTATEKSPDPAKPKPNTPSFSELIRSNSFPEHCAKDIIDKNIKSILVDKIKAYLNASDNSSMKYYVIPEIMKFLIANPAIMIYYPKFRATVEAKMNELNESIKTNSAISGHIITDKYRAEFKALSSILKSMTTIYIYVTLDTPFVDNIEKIANELDKAISTFNTNMM
jgi:hypothetical protein